MPKIVCFGEALIDLLALPPATPQTPRAFLQYAGGAPANVAVAAARLGADSHFAGMLARDMFGDFLLDSLTEAGVATACVVRTDEAKTALAFVALDAEGERSFSFHRPPSADLLFRAEHFRIAAFCGTGSFHVCSNTLTEAAIAETTFNGMLRAREYGALVSLDLNLRPALWLADVDPLPRLWHALSLADLVKLSREELDYLAQPYGGGRDGETLVLARLFEGHARLVIITDAAAPVRWFSREAKGQVPAFAVKPIDTTAAGDAFVGGLLYRLGEIGADGRGFVPFCADASAITDAIRFASAVGAIAVTRQGAFAAMPTLADVQQMMQQENEAHA